MTDAAVDAAVAAVLSQAEKGARRYGVPLTESGRSALDLLDDAIEECADQLTYLAALRIKMTRDKEQLPAASAADDHGGDEPRES